MFPTSKLKPFIVQAPRESVPEEVELEDASLDLCAWGNSLSDLAAALEAAGYAVDDDLVFDLAAFLQSLEDAGLSLDTLGTGYADLATWLGAFFASLEENLPLELQTVATTYEHLRAALQAVATGYLNLPMGMIAYGQSLSGIAAPLQAAGYDRQDFASYLAAVSRTVLVSLAMYLAATDGSSLNDMSLYLLARSRNPSFTTLVAQRVSAIATEAA